LAHDTSGAAEGGPHITHSVSLYPVPLPGLLPKEQGRDTGHDTPQQQVQDARLAHVLCILVGLDAGAEGDAAANAAVSKAVTEPLLPGGGLGHPDFERGLSETKLDYPEDSEVQHFGSSFRPKINNEKTRALNHTFRLCIKFFL